MSTATKGRAYEHEVRALFEAAGYSVIRGAGSKGECLKEKTDLVCTKETRANQFKVFLVLFRFNAK